MSYFNHFTFSSLITAITTFVLGLFVLFKGRWRRSLYVIFALYSFSIAWWSFCATKFTPDFQDSYLIWGRLLHLGAILIPAFFIHFVFEFLEEKNKKIILPCYLTAGIFLGFNFFTRLFIKGITNKASYSYPTPSIIYPFYFAFFVVCVIFGLYKLFKASLIMTGFKRNQIKYLLWSSLIGYIGGFKNFMILVGLEIFPIYPYGTYAIPIYVLVVTYAILKYRLMDITIALTRAGIFVLVYIPVVFLPFWIAPKFIHTGLWWIPILLMGILATLGIFIYNKLRRQAESLIRAEELYSHQLLKKAAEGMIRYRSLKELLNLIVHIVCKILKIENAITFLLDENTGDFNLSAVRFKSQYYYLEKLNRDDALVKRLSLLKQPLVYEEVRLKAQEEKDNPKAPIHEIESQMLKLKASLIVPAISKEKLLGFLVLSEKKSKRAYSAEDISTLWALSYQAALAIENALLYQKEKLFLAEQSRRQALADMAPGAAHQFDNRLFAISSIADSLLAILEEIDLENISLEKIKELIPLTIKKLKQIVDETIKGGQITEAILQKAKVKMEFSPTDIVKVIENTISLAKLRRTPQTLDNLPPPEIIFNHPKDLPLLMLCEGPIQDCIENIIDNACDAYVIKTKRFGEYRGIITITLSKKDNYVIIEIYDNGIGIAPENLNKIFTPYFTTKASSEKGVYGKAGLGMWVVRDFIERHKGQITVESEYTKWTKFTIKLPIDFKSE